MAITDFTYNSRGLTTQIAYTPQSGGVDAPTVDYTYDNAGNRTQMDTDGVSVVDYTYNELSQLASETTNFDDLTNNLTISYTYELGGSLKSVMDPFSYTVNYTNDKAGRVTTVAGATFAQHSNGSYADNIQYRAFGQTKQIDYKLPSSNTAAIKMSYDNALRVSHAEATEPGSTTSFVLNADYSYAPDGRTAAKDDTLNNGFDQTNTYDFAGRLTSNAFGTDANSLKPVYAQAIEYDAFSQMTERSTEYWEVGGGFTAAYTNGRKVSGTTPVPTYDDAGNVTQQYTGTASYQDSTYDASGRRPIFLERWRQDPDHTAVLRETEKHMVYDGDGHPVIEKGGGRMIYPNPGTMTIVPMKYHVWSSVLKQSMTWLWPSEEKGETNIYAGGALIATQITQGTTTTADDAIHWKTSDPVTGSTVAYYSDLSTHTEDVEPLGQRINTTDPGNSMPGTYQELQNSAAQAEWQCMAKSGPWACNSANLMDKYFQTPAPEKNPENPSKIPLKPGQGAPPTLKTPPEEKAKSRELAATQKPDAETEAPKDGCTYGSDGGPNDCTVQSQSANDPIAESDASPLQSGNQTPCEKWLAKALTGKDDTMFSDVTDGDPIDTHTGLNDDPANSGAERLQTHNHGYNPVADPTRATQIFAPAGGTVIGSGLSNSGSQSFVNIFYETLGGQANIVLQFFHTFHSKTFEGATVQPNGTLLVGTMGPNGAFGSGYGKLENGLPASGYHFHLNAWKWWGKIDKKTGKPKLKGAGLHPEGKNRSLKTMFSLSNLCPK